MAKSEEFPLKISPEIVKLLTEIDEFKGRWDWLKAKAPAQLDGLRMVSFTQSAGSSTRIEGSTLSDEEVAELLGNIKKKSFKSRDEEEVAGYADTLQLVYASFAEIPLDENHLKQLHGMLLRHSSKDQRHRGEYKKHANHVVATRADGKVAGIVFKTATPFDTPEKMRKLLAATNSAFKAGELHPLLCIADFVVRFLAIHPFQDGNGRLSRIVTNQLLLRQGYSYAPYSSLEHVIEANKAAYYLNLRKTQVSLETKKPDLNPWVAFFLRSLKAQKDYLAKVMEESRQLSVLDDLDAALVQLVRKHGKLGISQLSKLSGANRHTVKLRLSKLVKAGNLAREGSARATFYRPA